MNVHRNILFGIVLVIYGCVQKGPNKSGKRAFVISAQCEEELNSYFDRESCGKIEFLKNVNKMKSGCYSIVAEDMFKLTKVMSSMKGSYYGIYYPTDSLFRVDISNWENALQCE